MKVETTKSGMAIIDGIRWSQEEAANGGICLLSNRAFSPGDLVYRPVQEGTDHTLRILASELKFLTSPQW